MEPLNGSSTPFSKEIQRIMCFVLEQAIRLAREVFVNQILYPCIAPGESL